MTDKIPTKETLDYYEKLLRDDKDFKHLLNLDYTDLPFPPQLEDPEYFVPTISRDEWGALPPKELGEPLNNPLMYIRYTFVGKDECNSVEQCSRFIRHLQQTSMEEGLSDIPYNFLVGGKGIVYEGRGWSTEADREARFNDHVGLHGALKGQTIDIAYIGDMSVYSPPNDMMMGAAHFVREHATKGRIHEMFEVIPFTLERKNPDKPIYPVSSFVVPHRLDQ